MPVDLTAPPSPATTGVEGRAVDALLACVARTGWNKTTLDDIAREAGCSRATLYRYFSGKADLAAAALVAERARLSRALIDAVDDDATLEDALVSIVVTAARELTTHDALEFLLAFEPDVILPFMTFSAGDDMLAEAGRVVAPAIVPYLPEHADALRAGEWIARILFVHLLRPDTPFDLTTTDGAFALVHTFVAPALAGRPGN